MKCFSEDNAACTETFGSWKWFPFKCKDSLSGKKKKKKKSKHSTCSKTQANNNTFPNLYKVNFGSFDMIQTRSSHLLP